MSGSKRYHAGKGIVASADLGTVFQREIFFPVDPMTLDHMDRAEVQDLMPSGINVDIRPEKFLELLPELEAEIFYLIYFKKKHQKDIAKLLGLSQPTVSYRYRRTLAKLNYLMTLTSLSVATEIERIPFLKPHEKAILVDLFFFTNQEMVGKKHHVRQSSVKWIFVKTRRRLGEMERDDPTEWFNTLGLLLLLERNLNIRVLH